MGVQTFVMMILCPLNTHPAVRLLGHMVSEGLIFVEPSDFATISLMAVLVDIFFSVMQWLPFPTHLEQHLSSFS